MKTYWIYYKISRNGINFRAILGHYNGAGLQEIRPPKGYRFFRHVNAMNKTTAIIQIVWGVEK